MAAFGHDMRYLLKLLGYTSPEVSKPHRHDASNQSQGSGLERPEDAPPEEDGWPEFDLLLDVRQLGTFAFLSEAHPLNDVNQFSDSRFTI
ncbi:hypothetical protein KBY66_13695 [Synechococcus sp. Tobar12-5m-g]|uniref:hypothetical protein n=1 Tax=Synechococcus sp. Cruz CV-v-12 TaxID=2823728 RepID=UPI0020CF047D|nr:hypothetical protein [Synechococcus sp. Cruz CV-v-12]MCP9773653.1 hypothetical protein [Synechococcus sp. Tobar12-5m-g]MCP9874626.1 hypothetical protein [Synechococcus sp. Cruz CV-v-12]